MVFHIMAYTKLKLTLYSIHWKLKQEPIGNLFITSPPTISQCYGKSLHGTGEVEAPASSCVYQAVRKQQV